MSPAPDYGLEERPPLAPTLLMGLQWLAILIPGVIVLGRLNSGFWGLDAAAQANGLQWLFLLTALAQLAQSFLGHRLPGLVGPSSALLVGVGLGLGAGPGAVYGSMLLGGLILAAAGFLGLAQRLARLYTPPVLAASLVLIGISLCPIMLRMFHPAGAEGEGFGATVLFGIGLGLAMLWAGARLKGPLAAGAALWGMLLGSLLYYALGLEPWPRWGGEGFGPGLGAPRLIAPEFNPSALAAFCLCYLALAANEITTLKGVAALAEAGGEPGRIRRALGLQGLFGALAGLLGGVGTVTYGVSPAMVISSRSASRHTLWPVALLTLLLAFFPGAAGVFTLIPQPVVGSVLFMLLAQGMYAAIRAAAPASGGSLDQHAATVLGGAVFAGIVAAFIPGDAAAALRPWLRPILANGFVMGLLTAILLDVLLRKKA